MGGHASFNPKVGGRTDGAGVGSSGDWLPKRAEERAAVRAQLERILGNTAFRNSRRYPRFLGFVVEETLAGRAENLKERTIGVEVFGRAPDYDTNADHVVRTAAGEVRKRLAQFYLEPGRESDMRIDIHPGSYVPHFRLPAGESSLRIRDDDPVDASHEGGTIGTRRWGPILVLAALLACTALGYTLLRDGATTQPAAVDEFWGPVLASPERVLICIGGTRHPVPEEAVGADVAEVFTYGDFMGSGEQHVAFNDATALARIAGVLQARGKQFKIARRDATTLSDLRAGPAVLVGGGNNSWTQRVIGDLRFRMGRSEDRTRNMIIDAEDPSRTDWSFPREAPFDELNADYAIVSRLLDPSTERMVVVAAGIGALGTFAAGEFVSDPVHMEKLAESAPPGWEHMNLQVVLSTEVVNGSPGPPKVEAVHTW